MSELEQIKQRLDNLEQENKKIRQNTVHRSAIKRVLLEYDVSTDDVDTILTDIETVDNRLRGEADE